MRIPKKKPPAKLADSTTSEIPEAEVARHMVEIMSELKKQGFYVLGHFTFSKGLKTFSINADEVGRIWLMAASGLKAAFAPRHPQKERY